MNEDEKEFFETRIPILRRHYELVSCFNGQINEEETKKLFIYISQLRKDNRKSQQENQQLKKQLEYLRSGEYLNQLKFERNLLENIVQNGEVSKEDKEFIDMTHRNTELVEENAQLKSVLKEIREYIKDKQKIQYKFALSHIECDDILEIIDKGIGEEK